jgi:hypothetical protein
MWVNLKEVGMTQSLFECKNSNNGYNLLINSSKNVQLNYKKDSYEKNIFGPKLEKENWNLICLTLLNESNNKSVLNLYINSSLYIKDEIIDNTESINDMKPIIGKLISSGSKIDSITTWSRVLSKDEIVSLYNNGNGREYPFTLSDTNVPYDNTPYNIEDIPYIGDNDIQPSDIQDIPDMPDMPDDTQDIPDMPDDTQDIPDMPDDTQDIPDTQY